MNDGENPMNDIGIRLSDLLNKFAELNKKFFMEHNYKVAEYWKGQVMGMCKAIDMIDPDRSKYGINTNYFLQELY